MVADNEPSAPRSLSRGRMEAFSDGVLAIAITLLVLDLMVRPPGTPLQQFLGAWPSYLAYVISFLTIGGAWIAHNALTDDLERADTILLRINLLFLLLVAFLPFPTRLVAEGLYNDVAGERVATVVYGITLLAIRLLFDALDVYSRHAHLRRPGAEDADLVEEQRKYRYVIAGYLVTIAISALLPLVAVVLYFLIAIALVVPFRTVGHALTRRSVE